MKRISEWFQSLQQRERTLVGVACALLAVLLVTFAGVSFYKIVNTRTARVERKEQDLAWLRSVAPTVRTLAMSQPGMSGESLVVLVERTAQQAGLANSLTGQTQSGEQGTRVRLESANFDSLVAWLSGLQRQSGINIESAAIDRTEKSGIVNVTLVLTRGGS